MLNINFIPMHIYNRIPIVINTLTAKPAYGLVEIDFLLKICLKVNEG